MFVVSAKNSVFNRLAEPQQLFGAGRDWEYEITKRPIS